MLLVGLFAQQPLGIPISAVAAVCAAILFAVAAKGYRIFTRRVLREVPWQVVVFSLGMYLVVYGLKNAGLMDALTHVFDRLAGQGLWSASIGTGLLSALLSSVMNNMPRMLPAKNMDGSANYSSPLLTGRAKRLYSRPDRLKHSYAEVAKSSVGQKVGQKSAPRKNDQS